MAYSETRIVISGLTHIPILIFIANFIKGKFGVKSEEVKKLWLQKNKLKETLVKEEKAKSIKELTNKLDNIEVKADEVYEKMKIKKDMKRD